MTLTMLFALLTVIPKLQSSFPGPYRVPFFAFPVQIVMVVLLLFGLLIIGTLFFYREKIDWSRGLKTIIFFTIIFGVELVLIPPLGSEDVYLYLGQGRIMSIWQENPYTVPFEQFPQDPLYDWVYPVWRSWPAVYGPVWLMFEAVIALFGQTISVTGMVILFRLGMLAIHLLSLWIFWKIIKNKPRPYPEATFLALAWNPLILFEVINNAHNEGLIVLFMLISIYWYQKEKYAATAYALTLAGLVKYSFFALLPVWWIGVGQKWPIRKKIIALVTSLFIIIPTFVPWWEGAATFDGFLQHNQEVSILNAPLVMVVLSLALFALRLEESFIVSSITILAPTLFLLLTLMILRRQSRQKYSYLTATLLILAGVFFFIAPNAHPWYALWFLPPLLIIKKYRWFWLLSILGIINYLFFGLLNSLLLAIGGVLLFTWEKNK